MGCDAGSSRQPPGIATFLLLAGNCLVHKELLLLQQLPSHALLAHLDRCSFLCKAAQAVLPLQNRGLAEACQPRSPPQIWCVRMTAAGGGRVPAAILQSLHLAVSGIRATTLPRVLLA